VETKITVYSTDACSFCVRAKRLLDARGVDYADINLARDPDGRAELARRTGMLSFPQILIGDELLGGFMELAEADRSGRLSELLEADAA
jgi:glutaredoxin 3